MKKVFFLFSMLFCSFSYAQDISFYPSNYIRFLDENGDTLRNAFAGGMMNPMFSNIDLNNDGRQDLFVFDRGDNKIFTFLSVKTKDSVKLVYAPQYEAAFPKCINWVILKDFNGDGKADIFMHGARYYDFNSQMLAYKNVSTKDSLKFVLYKSPVNRETGKKADAIGPISVGTGIEVPTFSDLDNDGDVDMLGFDPTFNGLVYYYKNMSKELYGHSDSLTYWLYDQCWGYFNEAQSSEIFLARDNCIQNLVKRSKSGAHAGSTLLALDTDGDGDKDLLVGDVLKPNLIHLQNARIKMGHSPRIADSIDYQTNDYPINKPVRIMSMPLASSVDINGNGAGDLLISPMDPGSQPRNFVWLYNNISKGTNPIFKYIKSNFLEDEMVDWGLYSAPCFFYYDKDSLPDLLLGVQGESGGSAASHILRYKNIGTSTKAVFKLEDEDFMGFGSLTKVTTFVPAVSDVDADGKADLLLGVDSGTVGVCLNIGTGGQAQFSWPPVALMQLKNNQKSVLDAGNFSRPAAADLSGDGKIDLLLGNSSGQLSYYKNITSKAGNPEFEYVSDTFLTLSSEKHLAPCLADLDKNGKPDLLVGSRSGKIYLYSNISGSPITADAKTDLFFDFQSDAFEENKGALNTVIGAASLDQDGKPDLLIGNLRGGLYFMGSKNNGQSISTGIEPQSNTRRQNIKLRIYPNPAGRKVNLEWQNDNISEPMLLHLTDISGRQIWQNKIKPDASSPAHVVIDLPKLTNGIYFLHLFSNDGNISASQKLFIIN